MKNETRFQSVLHLPLFQVQQKFSSAIFEMNVIRQIVYPHFIKRARGDGVGAVIPPLRSPEQFLEVSTIRPIDQFILFWMSCSCISSGNFPYASTSPRGPWRPHEGGKLWRAWKKACIIFSYCALFIIEYICDIQLQASLNRQVSEANMKSWNKSFPGPWRVYYRHQQAWHPVMIFNDR